jgi:small conductance mechanosensitive channel
MGELWRRIAEGPTDNYLVRAVGVVIILVVGWVVVHFLVGPLRRLLERSRIDPSAASFVANTVRTLILVAILVAVLQQVGVPMASLLTLLGAAGLAIALSLQGSLANFASGLLVLSFRIVRVGDFIEVGDVRGRVRELLPFHVVLETLDNQRITVPNTMLTNTPVRNHSTFPVHRVQWTLPVPASADLAAVKETLRGRLRQDPRVLADPPPQVHVQEWAADKRVLAVTAWTSTADHVAVQQDLLEELGRAIPPAS